MARGSVEAEFSELVHARWAHLVRTAMALGCSREEAEDVAQSALTKCLRAWGRVRRAQDRDAYVHRVLVNTFLDARRRRSSTEVPARTPTSVPVGDHGAAVDDRVLVGRALDRLTTEQRTVVVLRYYLDLSEAQMAAVLDVAPGTVKSRLSRALQHLARDPDLREDRP